MNELAALAWASYAIFLFFVAALALNIKKYISAPIHLKWELYPVPQEEGHEHGGSYLENVDWWKGGIKENRASELKELLEEMLFIKRLYRNKRDVWYFSFLFHGGIYLILLWFVLLLASAVTQAVYAPVAVAQWAAYPNAWSRLLFYATVVVGYVGVTAATIGDVGLLAKRISNKNELDISAPADFFNLALVLAVLISGLVALAADPTFVVARDFMTYLISGLHVAPAYAAGLTAVTSPEIAAQLILLMALLTYMPFSKMTHFLGKYFTYHRVLWDSRPFVVMPEGAREKLRENLKQELPWSAQHVPHVKWEEVNRNEGQ